MPPMLRIISILLPFISAALVAVFLINLLIPVAKKIDLVDHPGERKRHEGAIPLIGGIAMVISFALSILLFQASFKDFRILFFCIGVLTVIGALDDQRELKPKMRFLAELFVALVLASIGGTVVIHIGDIFAIDRPIGLSFLAIPFTVISIVGVINAYNMVDGHNGVAGIVTILGLAGLALLLFYRATPADYQYVVIVYLLITLLVIFLMFNLGLLNSNRRIFLGDAGSMFIGITMAFLVIRLSQREDPILSATAAAWIIGLPLLDMVSVIIRRTFSRISLFQADRNHIHHLLTKLDLSKLQVLLYLTMLQSLFVSIGVLGTLLEWSDAILFWGMIPMLSIYFILYGATLRRPINHP